MEGDLHAKRRALHEKEQDLLAAQRKNEHLKQAAEERNKRFERREEEHRANLAEVQKLRAAADSLQDRLSLAERERKALEQRLRQSELHSDRVEQTLKEQVDMFDESLRREQTRRRELEEDKARTGAELALGGTELAKERQRADELQRRVAQLEAEEKARMAEKVE